VHPWRRKNMRCLGVVGEEEDGGGGVWWE